jgi:hypothetical protein
MNIGRNVEDSIAVEISQGFPDGSVKVLRRDTVPAPAFSLTRDIKLPNPGKPAVGLNTLYIKVDADNRVEELPQPEAELNNELARPGGEPGIPFFVLDNTARPIYPPEFAIVGEPEVVLKASTTDALAPERTYIMEIDTTARFDSPLLQRTEIRQTGGLLKWSPTLPLQDSVVYYWRVSPDSTDAVVGYAWANSSFTFIRGSLDGWSQGHYWQWLEGEKYHMHVVDSSRTFDFSAIDLEMRIRNKVWNEIDRPGFIYNNQSYAGSVRPWDYLTAGVSVMVGIPRNGHFWVNTGQAFGSEDSSGKAVFSFKTSTLGERQKLIDFLVNTIPTGFYVYLFTVQKTANSNYHPQDWASDSLVTGTNIYKVLEEQGASLVNMLSEIGSVPYALMYKKDHGLRDEEIAESVTGEVNVNSTFPQYFQSGYIASPVIGPSKNWDRLILKIQRSEIPNDSAYVNLYGIDQNFEEKLLAEKLVSDKTLNFINAEEYPFLKLKYIANTQGRHTPSQLKFWRVFYEGLPESAINPQIRYHFYKDSIQQGDHLIFELGIENLSKYSMDSLLVKYILTDQNNNSQSFFKRLASLEAGDTLVSTFHLNTRDLRGLMQILMEVNPEKDQPELYHPNNFATKSFFVWMDQKNPILDVTFDGMHIMNRDLVAPNPLIVITLKDENPYLAITDTSNFVIKLKYPDGNIHPIFFNHGQIRFFPSDLQSGNRASIEFNPVFEQDGIYQLIVQGKDASGNSSGLYAYEVEFEVITRKMISNVLNYPNPFSTSTQFVFTITGEIPSYFKIQIMTISGRIVREITLDEIGPLKYGVQRTEYTWDGRDEFGDRLANGVYLYRVIAKDAQGKDYETYQGAADRFFRGGFGKMVLLR